MRVFRAAGLSKALAALLTAHVSIENRDGQSVFMHNIGNLTVSAANEATQPFWRPPWFDEPGPEASQRNKDLHARMLRGLAPRAFAAFGSFEEGIDKYLDALESRFAPMLAAKTPQEFVRQWKATGYTPDLNVERTLTTFVPLAKRLGWRKAASSKGGGLGFVVVGLGVAGAVYFLATRKGKAA